MTTKEEMVKLYANAKIVGDTMRAVVLSVACVFVAAVVYFGCVLLQEVTWESLLPFYI